MCPVRGFGTTPGRRIVFIHIYIVLNPYVFLIYIYNTYYTSANPVKWFQFFGLYCDCIIYVYRVSVLSVCVRTVCACVCLMIVSRPDEGKYRFLRAEEAYSFSASRDVIGKISRCVYRPEYRLYRCFRYSCR